MKTPSLIVYVKVSEPMNPVPGRYDRPVPPPVIVTVPPWMPWVTLTMCRTSPTSGLAALSLVRTGRAVAGLPLTTRNASLIANGAWLEPVTVIVNVWVVESTPPFRTPPSSWRTRVTVATPLRLTAGV